MGGAAGLGWLATQPPVAGMIDLILKDTVRTAHASSNFVDSKYLLVALHGAPNRWIFDQFLQTRHDQSVVPTPGVHTSFVSSHGAYRDSEYRLIDHAGRMLVPPLWGSQVPAANGGTRPMNELLKHMITVRGYGTGIDGHPTNGAAQTNPVPSAGSISGHLADHSSTLFKAVQFVNFGTFSGFSSLNGSSVVQVRPELPSSNYAAQVLQPFGAREDAVSATALRDRYAAYIDQSQHILKRAVQREQADFAAVAKSHEQALQKIKAGIPALKDTWAGLYNKYHSLLQRAFSDRTVPGFSDQPVPTGPVPAEGFNKWTFFRDNGDPLVPTEGQDMRDWVNQADLGWMAAGFALAEFVLTQNLVSAFELFPFHPLNLELNVARSPAGAQGPVRSLFVYDQHLTGSMAAIFLNACLYRAIAAGLLELIDRLNDKNMFDRTVIHFTQDFGRSPRSDGTGSDHNFNGMISSLITGKQNSGPVVLGNVLSHGSQGAFDPNVYSGTFGYRAPTSVSGQTVLLTPAHVASTIAVLLGLPFNPWGNVAAPLVSAGSSGIHPLAGAEIVSA